MASGDGFTEEDRQMIREAAAKVNTVHRIVTGESEPDRGLVVRVDRLEQARLGSSKLGWAAITAGIGAVALGLKNWISNGGHQP